MAVVPTLRYFGLLHPQRTAIFSATQQVSWGELIQRIDTASVYLQQCLRHHAQTGSHPTPRVAIACSSPLNTLIWFLAADSCGVTALIIADQWTDRERQNILDRLQPNLVLIGTPPRGRAPAAIHHGKESSDDTLFYAGTTSGSSAEPKVYLRTRGSWRESFVPLDKICAAGSEDIMLVTGSLASSLFLFSALHGLNSGSAVFFTDSWSASTAANAARRATMMHAVPSMLETLCDELDNNPEFHRECSLRTVLCCGAKLSERLDQRLRTLLPHCQLIEYYGSSEHSLIAYRNGEKPFTVGTPVINVDVEIRNADGNAVPTNHEGDVWVRSPFLFAGYLTESGLDRDAFDANGWLSNGDRGILHNDGSLEIRAREGQTVITTGGHQVSTAEVESVLRDIPEISEVVVIGTEHARLGSVVTAIIEPRPNTALCLHALRSHVAQYLGPAKRPRRWWSTPSLPRTVSGKVCRIPEIILRSQRDIIR